MAKKDKDKETVFHISGLPKTATWTQVYRAIQVAFKSRNFSLVMEPVPTVTIPAYFSQKLASSNVTLDGIRLGFSTESGSLSRVAKVYRDDLPMPLIDHLAEERRKIQLETLRHSVRIIKTQFGTQLPPEQSPPEDAKPTFSAEWETEKDAYMSFDDKEREIIIKIGDHTDAFHKEIRIKMSNIKAVSNGFYYQPFVILDLKIPPTFIEQIWQKKAPPPQELIIDAGDGGLDETQVGGNARDNEPQSSWQDEYLEPAEGPQEDPGKVGWCRRAYFDDHHKRVNRFASKTMRLVLADDHDHLAEFMKMSEATNLPQLRASKVQEVTNRGAYSRDNLERLAKWIESPRVPWVVGFQLEALLYNRTLIPAEISSLESYVMPIVVAEGAEFASHALKHFHSHITEERSKAKKAVKAQHRLEESYDFGSAVEYFEKAIKEYRGAYDQNPPKTTRFPCHHVTFTPTAVVLKGPDPDQGNRILRQFPHHRDHFVRVHFSDEDEHRYPYVKDIDNESFIDKNVGGILHHGFTLAGRHFEFVGYSNSSLKEHSCWFFAPILDQNGKRIHDPDSIRASIGDFSDPKLLRNPAKLAARIGQALSATDPSVRVGVDEIEWVPDIQSPYKPKAGGPPADFTDGCGTISPDLAEEIWRTLLEQRVARHHPDFPPIPPKVFQIRLGPAKGMVSVDYTLAGKKLIRIRNSMKKFEPPIGTSSMDIEISSFPTRPGPMYLNRPLVTLLETLGVKHPVFLRLLAEAKEDIEQALQTPLGAANLMRNRGLGKHCRVPNTIELLDRFGIGSLCKDDVTLRKSRNYALYHVLRDIKYRARVPVPNGYTLVGVADVHGVVRAGEIYACIHESGKEPIFLEGDFLVTRSPMIHPGDIQLVRAIGRPNPGSPYDKENLPNCVVFACMGARPLPNCLGGGDLDGDLFNLVDMTKQPDLRPPAFDEPASYAGPDPLEIDHDATHRDIADFYTQYMMADSLGLISVRHRLIADQERDGARNEKCYRLSKQHSDAVDYPKTGRPVRYKSIEKDPPRKPDWFAGELLNSTNGDYYISQRALGLLYRRTSLDDAENRCKSDPDFPTAPSAAQNRQLIEATLKPRIDALLGNGPRLTLSSAQILHIYLHYSSELAYIRATHSIAEDQGYILSEEEVFVGSIFARSSKPGKRQKTTEQMHELTGNLADIIRLRLSGHEERMRDTLSHDQARAWLAQSWKAFNMAKDAEFNLQQNIPMDVQPNQMQSMASPGPVAPLPKLSYLSPSQLSAQSLGPSSSPTVLVVNGVGSGKGKKKGKFQTVSLGPAKAVVNNAKSSSVPNGQNGAGNGPRIKSPMKPLLSLPQPRSAKGLTTSLPVRAAGPTSTGSKPPWANREAPTTIASLDAIVPNEGAKTFAWIALTSVMEAVEFLEKIVVQA